MFTHVHYVDGVIITHSHPNNGEHTHTDTEIILIDRLSDIQTLSTLVSGVPAPDIHLIHSTPIYKLTSVLKNTDKEAITLRGPPIL